MASITIDLPDRQLKKSAETCSKIGHFQDAESYQQLA